MKIAAIHATNSPGATNSLGRGTPLSREVEESQQRTTLNQGANGMAKEIVAHVIELLEDVVRDP
jgi:hypothetical protein